MPVLKGIPTSKRQQLSSAVHGFCSETDPCRKPLATSENEGALVVSLKLVKGLAKARPVKFTA
jgi:hypothetical protein